MKKLTRKQRERDVRQALAHRSQQNGPSFQAVNISDRANGIFKWLSGKVDQGLNIQFRKRKKLVIVLPPVMNLSTHYEETANYLLVIRKLADISDKKSNTHQLGSVNFDSLRQISTSAALLLTAELSRWDDHIRNRLAPNVDNWDARILNKFFELGFFDLFIKRPEVDLTSAKDYSVKVVKYLKGGCTDKDYRRLKLNLTELIGEPVKKWTFLHGGIDEAITNVSHHAYPISSNIDLSDSNWYLTGAYDKRNSVIKIVFYDQGIGIPKALPASKLWERILAKLDSIPIVERRKDEILLKAAMEVSRTGTGKGDRGKGLPDMKEFIKQKQQGYLSVISRHGLYKYSIDSGVEHAKTIHFNVPICGTLIIWKTKL